MKSNRKYEKQFIIQCIYKEKVYSSYDVVGLFIIFGIKEVMNTLSNQRSRAFSKDNREIKKSTPFGK